MLRLRPCLRIAGALAPRRGVSNVLRAFSAVSTVLPLDQRPRLVILGCGWGAMNLLQNLDKRAIERYQILVCSPTNHFVNTPLLPSVTVGTIEPRSIAEPIRNVLAKHRRKYPKASIKFHEVEAVDIDTKKKSILVRTRGVEGRAAFRTVVKGMASAIVESTYPVSYDVLVCAVGATTNTFGTPGALEYCTFLKTIQDAIKIRSTILDCFETAVVLGKAHEDIDRLLSFVIIGAGPTGVEIAAELRDFVKEDIIPRYVGFKDKVIRITIVEMGGALLGTYEKLIQEYTRERFEKDDIEMCMEHQVVKVNPKSVEAKCLKTGEMKEIPFGMCVWASGVRPNQISLDIAKQVQGGGMLSCDKNLRVRGAEGTIFALGDCAKITLQTPMKEQARELFRRADLNNDGVLSLEEFQLMIRTARKELPHLESHLGGALDTVESMYKHADQIDPTQKGVSFEAFQKACEEVDKKLKYLPPTAQVASQQGKYLATLFNGVQFEDLGHADGLEPAFEYKHAGSMAYVGGEHAVIESPIFGVQTGLLTYVLWKGVYWSNSVSFRMKLNMVFDWSKSWFLGRDVSRF